MNILFLDQSGKLGGAELSLLDLVEPYHDRCLVGLFTDGHFHELLRQHQIPVQVLMTQPLQIQKNTSILRIIASVPQLMKLVQQVAQLSRSYDLLYANTQKAFVIGAIVSAITRRPLVYHLRDILSPEHFSPINLRAAVGLANRFASLVIANSQATQKAFIEIGGNSDLVQVVYNGFEPERYHCVASTLSKLRQDLDLSDRFVVWHFSRLSPWKGQHVLIEALTQCPENVTAVMVGDALFEEQEYVEQLHQQVKRLKLGDRIVFTGQLPYEQLPQYISAMDVCLSTQSNDLVGMVRTTGKLPLYLAYGRYVIATDVGEAKRVLPGVGWLLSYEGVRDVHHPARLADHLKLLLAEPERLQVAAAARDVAQNNFDYKLLTNRVEKVVQMLFKEHSKPQG